MNKNSVRLLVVVVLVVVAAVAVWMLTQGDSNPRRQLSVTTNSPRHERGDADTVKPSASNHGDRAATVNTNTNVNANATRGANSAINGTATNADPTGNATTTAGTNNAAPSSEILVRVVLKQPNGSLVAHAFVTITNESGWSNWMYTLGRSMARSPKPFQFVLPARGPYRVVAEAPHFATTAREFVATSGETVVEIELSQGNVLDGKVVDVDRKPVRNAWVKVAAPLTMFDHDRLAVYTDQEGRFRVTDLPLGRFGVEVRCDQGVAAPDLVAEIAAPQNWLEIQLLAEARVTLKLRDTRGQPILGYYDTRVITGDYDRKRRPAPKDEYTFAVPPLRNVVITVTASEYVTQFYTVNLRPDEHRELIAVLEDGITLTVNIDDAPRSGPRYYWRLRNEAGAPLATGAANERVQVRPGRYSLELCQVGSLSAITQQWIDVVEAHTARLVVPAYKTVLLIVNDADPNLQKHTRFMLVDGAGNAVDGQGAEGNQFTLVAPGKYWVRAFDSTGFGDRVELVELEPQPRETTKHVSLSSTRRQDGVWITAVERGGVADAAGLRLHDVLVSHDGRPFFTAHIQRLFEPRPHLRPFVQLEVWRDGRIFHLDLTRQTEDYGLRVASLPR